MIIKRLVLSFLFILFLASCASKTPQTINQKLPGNYSLAQIENAIMKAGADRKWTMKKMENNTINGSITVRNYRVDIRIPYSKDGYTIEYVYGEDSITGKATTVKNYPRWSAKLNQSIINNLAKTNIN